MNSEIISLAERIFQLSDTVNYIVGIGNSAKIFKKGQIILELILIFYQTILYFLYTVWIEIVGCNFPILAENIN